MYKYNVLSSSVLFKVAAHQGQACFGLMTPVSVRTFGAMYDHTVLKLANHEIRYQCYWLNDDKATFVDTEFILVQPETYTKNFLQ